MNRLYQGEYQGPPQSLLAAVCLRHAFPTPPLPSWIAIVRVNAAAPGEIDPVTDSYDIDVVLKPPPSISLGGYLMVPDTFDVALSVRY